VIVRQAIVADPRVLQADVPAREAAALLAKPNVSSVFVADGDRLLGCVTKEAVVAAVAADRDLRNLAVWELADSDVPSVSPGVPLDEALILMAEGGHERLAVVEDGKLLGILPREPVVRRLAEDDPRPPPEEP
jgi:CBS domain-containing protein